MTGTIPDAVSDTYHSESITREFVSKYTDIQHDIVICLYERLILRETGDILGCSSANVAYHIYAELCGQHFDYLEKLLFYWMNNPKWLVESIQNSQLHILNNRLTS